MSRQEQPGGGVQISAVGYDENCEALPPYEYTGDDGIEKAVYEYTIKEFGQHFDESDVSIPCPVIIAVDEEDNGDFTAYGDFWILNYELKGDMLECLSGGSFPGAMHIKGDGVDFSVTSFDAVEDGGGYIESAKRIFKDHYDELMEVTGNSDSREKLRKIIIEEYVRQNDLSITKYQDYGWDPVELFDEDEVHIQTTDPSGCDTFTQIVDKKLSDGQGYANIELGEAEEALLVSSGIFDNGDGTDAAIDAEIFIYNEGKPFYLGYVECGGTADPLAVKDGTLYTAAHHHVGKYTVKDGRLETVEEAWEIFDSDGNATYEYSSADGNADADKAEQLFNSLYNEYTNADVIAFTMVVK